jgi:hypothetical protein
LNSSGAPHFLRFFSGVVEECFCWVFCELWCAKRGFLHGKCGANVVMCVVESDNKCARKYGTGFWDLFSDDDRKRVLANRFTALAVRGRHTPGAKAQFICID